MKIIRWFNLLNLIFVAITAAVQLAAGSPAPDSRYAAIWLGREGSAPAAAQALACYANVITLSGRIENATKHTLKHMTFPRAAGQPVPRQLLCWVIPRGDGGRSSAEAALEILSDLYNTAGSVSTIKKLMIGDMTNQDLITAIDSLVTYANKVKEKLGFLEDYVYQDGVTPIWNGGIAVSTYETELRSNVKVQEFIGAWRMKPDMNPSNIQTKMTIQRDYFSTVSSAHPEIMACFQYCIRKILHSAFADVSNIANNDVRNITKIGPALWPVGKPVPMPTTLYRVFPEGGYAAFAKAVAASTVGAADLPAEFEVINTDVQAMTDYSELAHLRVGIGHELRGVPPSQHYETDIRTIFVGDGGA